jgi:hypothetical protein
MMSEPFDQIIPIYPAVENEQALRNGSRPKAQTIRPDSAPMRCQLWDGNRYVGVVPVIFDDMGHPTDVVFSPGEVERVTKLAFLWGGKVYVHPLGEPITIHPGNPLHLMLRHLKLLTKYGTEALQAGRS